MMEQFEKLHDNHPAKLEIARLRRENEDLKRENKKLGELPYLLRMLNIARDANVLGISHRGRALIKGD